MGHRLSWARRVPSIVGANGGISNSGRGESVAKPSQDIECVSLGTPRGSVPEFLGALQRRVVVALALDWLQVHGYTVVASIRSYSACVPMNRMNMICLSYRIATTSL